MKRVHELRHPTSLTVLSAPWTRSTSLPLCSPVFPTQSSSTPSLHPFKYHSPTGASLPSPSSSANTRNKCKLHEYGCIPDVWTPPHFTPLQPQLHSTSLYSSAVPFHGVSSVQLNPTHHCMRADMQCRQSDASRQAGGQACRAGKQAAGKQTRKQSGEHAGRQASGHASMWFFGCLCFSSQRS